MDSTVPGMGAHSAAMGVAIPGLGGGQVGQPTQPLLGDFMNGVAQDAYVQAFSRASTAAHSANNMYQQPLKQEHGIYSGYDSLTNARNPSNTASAAAFNQALQQAGGPRTSVFSLPTGMVPNPVTQPMMLSSDPSSLAPLGMEFVMPLQQQQLQQQQQQQQQQQLQQQQQQHPWLNGSSSFFDAKAQFVRQQHHHHQPPQHSASFTAGCLPVAANSLSYGARSQSQALSSNSSAAVPAAPAAAAAAAAAAAVPDDEPDLSHLTVMQRYHARRKLAVQRMEREVEEKIAQLAVLEQENRKLKWQAHILENMLLDIDKQLEVMAHSDAAPDASQWLTLLGMGQANAHGGRVTRTVHRMLEGAGQIDVSTWTAQDCRRRWLDYLQQLTPLLEQAEAVQAEYRAAQVLPMQQEQNSAGSGGGRRPRRAAATAAAAVIQHEAADLLGVAPPSTSAAGPAVPLPPAPLSSSPSASAQALSTAPAGRFQQQQQQQWTASVCSDGAEADAQPCGSHNSDSSLSPSHDASVEGVPSQLLSQIEDLVLRNFYWLLAVMTTNPLLTYEFISMDLVEGTRPLPPQDSTLWSDVINRVQPSLEQMQECSTCIQVSRRCMSKVMEERAEIQESMQCNVESEMHTHLSEDVLQLNCRDAAVDRMRANVRKESVVRNMVGFYCINVFSLYQLAKVSVGCAPWFCMAWRVIGAMDERLQQQLAEPSRQAAARGNGSGHNTRASARLAAQR